MRFVGLTAFLLVFALQTEALSAFSGLARSGISLTSSLHKSSSCRSVGAKKSVENEETVDLEYLKSELIQYLAKRKDLGADELAKREVGKPVGGTKGNAVLEFVSGAPNKETRIEAVPNALDYDQLSKYGYSHLVTPIMKAGGRLVMYELLGMEVPDTSQSLKPLTVTAPKLVIDREGKNDKARYSGLKLGLVIDSELQAQILAKAQERAARGEDLRPRLEEEDFIQPFADKRNVGPRMTPDWTPEKLDEWGRQQGKSQAWARRAREGAFIKDPLETVELDAQQRVFSIVMGSIVATAFGKSTPTFLEMAGLLPDEIMRQTVLGALQGPSVGLVVVSLGSFVFCASSAKKKNRSRVVWALKGLLGGPLTVRALRKCEALLMQAQGAEEDQEKLP